MRLIILKGTVFSTIMSMIGAVFVGIGLCVGAMGWQDFMNIHTETALKEFGIMAIFFAIGAVFYVPAYKSHKKAIQQQLETEREYAEKKFKLSEEEQE